MKIASSIFLLATGLLTGSAALAQSAASALTGGTSSGVGSVAAANELSYSFTVSNSAIFGYSGANGFSDSVNVAGNAGYVSASERHPTSFVYSGGYLFGNNGQPSSSFQNFGVSQVLNTRQWTFVASDVISYLPSTPRFGLAGVPGVGDTGSLPIATGGLTGDAVLTNYGQRITNSASGSADYRITGRTSINTYAGYTMQKFLGDVGINNNFLNAGSQVQHSVTAATLVGVGYSYSYSTFPGLTNLSFKSNTVSGILQHTFSPRLSMQASIGPQWTNGSNSTLFPSRVSIAANVGVNYVAGRNNYSLNYSRGTSTGSGVLLGVVSDYLNFAGQRRFSENWSGGLFAGYGHAQSLANDPALYTSTNSLTMGLQTSRRLGEHFSAYGSYALQYQAVGQVLLTNNAFSGTAHVISAGVTYSPRPIHVGRR